MAMGFLCYTPPARSPLREFQGAATVPYWLGLDVGTTGSRAVVIDPSGAVRGAASAEHAPMVQPRPTWAEQDPEDWWRAACEAIPAALARSEIGAEDIAGV